MSTIISNLSKKTLTALTLAAAAFAAPLTATAGEFDRRYDDRAPRYEDRTPRYEDRGRYDDRGRHDRRDEGPRAGDLVRIGSVTTHGGAMDRDVIEVRDHVRYTAFVFRVDRGDAVIEDVKVTFANDQSYSPPVSRHYFREGSRSTRVDLPGFDRDIKRVRFLYRSANGAPVTIEVFGVLP